MKFHLIIACLTTTLFVRSALGVSTEAVAPELPLTQRPYNGICINGAEVRERFCKFFVHFNTNEASNLDSRIADSLGIRDASQTRSIGFIIANSHYPNLNIPGANLTAAAVDADKLTEFLITTQKFDEVIVLRNQDATIDNINYFLDEYLIHHAGDYSGKARLLIAYTGHGRQTTPTQQAAFILSNADDVNGSTNIYKMRDFSNAVRKLAPHYFHVLTLVNACYGGDLFGSGAVGGNPDSFSEPGSYAITAGPSDKLVFSLDPKRGSLFFDLIVRGVTEGIADPNWPFAAIDTDGKALPGSYQTRTAALNNYLTSAFQRINRERSRIDNSFVKLETPWIGPAQETVARGGFFFLSDQPRSNITLVVAPYINANTILAANSTSLLTSTFGIANSRPNDTESIQLGDNSNPDLNLGIDKSVSNEEVKGSDSLPQKNPSIARVTNTIDIPPGPISSIVGRPDIKIFKAPQLYPIRGIDISFHNGKIDWKKFFESKKFDFVYVRSNSWSGVDKNFKDYWSHLKSSHVDYGAQVVFDFCAGPKQFETIIHTVPKDPEALPMAIILVTPVDSAGQVSAGNKRQAKCYPGNSIAKNEILDLAARLRQYYGKTPVLYGNVYNLNELTDDRFDEYMLWLAAYGKISKEKELSQLKCSQSESGYLSKIENTVSIKQLGLRGSNPWTIWQHTGQTCALGIGQTTAEVFFGTSDEYRKFKNGTFNVARQAVLPLAVESESNP